MAASQFHRRLPVSLTGGCQAKLATLFWGGAFFLTPNFFQSELREEAPATSRLSRGKYIFERDTSRFLKRYDKNRVMVMINLEEPQVTQPTPD